jgi:hypothetical protein
LLPQYGEVTQVMPASAIVIRAAMAQANGTHPAWSRAASTRESAAARRDRGLFLRVTTKLLSAAEVRPGANGH